MQSYINMKKINYLNMLTKLSKILILFCYSSICLSTQIITDQEMQDGLEKLVAPIVKLSGISNLKIHILHDNDINAFTAGGNVLYINSGCLRQLLDPNMIIAITAHEMGHIKRHHVSRKRIEIKDLKYEMYSTLALGILAGMNLGIDIYEGVIAAGMTITEGGFLKNSRAMENSADQYACHLLTQANINPQSLIDFFTYLTKIERGMNLKPYTNTHPLSTQRSEFTQRCTDNFENTKQNRPASSHDVIFFKRIQLKLDAFFTDKIDSMLKNFENDNSNNAKYVRSILYFRLKKFQKAIKLANDLVAQEPNNPYFYEWQGQLLFNLHQYDKSLACYKKALQLLPNAHLIVLEKIRVELEINSKPRDYITTEIYDVLSKYPNNFLAYRLLITYGDKAKDEATKYYATSRTYALIGKKGMTTQFINLALSKAKQYSPIWYKIKDFMEEMKTMNFSKS